MATNLAQGVADLARKIALDQIEQDIENNGKFALKGDVASTEIIQQMIGFCNGYNGTSLDYRDYLTNSANDALTAFYAFGKAYKGVV